MERKKQLVSSFTSDIFGAKESSLPASSSSAGVFASIFPPPPKVNAFSTNQIVGRRLSLDFVGSQQKQAFGNHAWSSKHGDPALRSESGSCNTSFKEGSIFREETGEPCHLSSSLLYGGRDVYSRSSGNQATSLYPMSKKDGVEDDRNGSDSPDASRGNWWQDLAAIYKALGFCNYFRGIQKPD